MSAAEEFLSLADQFHLGDLDTERQHPKTIHLSDWAHDNLTKAVAVLKEVDLDALNVLAGKAESLHPLAVTIRETLDRGNMIYLCGCGATGRLSLSLELFCRSEGMLPEALGDSVIAFMAGGDAALIRSIEGFEDHPEWGARQLEELGFADGDLLISSTEGGETPFVIGATERAARLSYERPFFLYCNPDDVLQRVAERSRRVLENEAIRKINLSVGPMALSGSTRMQSSTVLMAAIGFSMLHRQDPQAIGPALVALRDLVARTDESFVEKFILAESEIYQAGEHVLYEPGPFCMTVLTDTTERSPTFTLVPFERENSPTDRPCLCYLHLEGTNTPEEAWTRLLCRDVRSLEWEGQSHRTGRAALMSYDFSDAVVEKRAQRTAGKKHWRFDIDRVGDHIIWELKELRHDIPLEGAPLFAQHLLLKMLLNIHSTLIMGRLGRYVDNMMTYVAPSNFKLIDRAIRYVRALIERRHGQLPSYEETAHMLFRERERLQPNEPIVLKTMEAILREPKA